MAFNPKSKANLITYKKGESGNPKGKPPGTLSFSTILRNMLEGKSPINEIDPKTKKTITRTRREAICKTLLDLAESGDIKAIKELMERLEGKAIQATHLTISDKEETHDEWVNRVLREESDNND